MLRQLIGRRRREAWGLVRAAGEDRLVRARRDAFGIRLAPQRRTMRGAGAARRSELRLGRRAVVVPLADLSLRHERLSLPPLSASLIDRAVQQHCLGMQSGEIEIEVSYARDEGAADAIELLVAWAPRAVVASTLEGLAADDYVVDRLVTPAVALSGLLQAAGAGTDADGSTVLVHLGERFGSVGCHTDGQLVLGREFNLGDLEQTLEEISRSILLFNHRLRGKRAARILVSSDGVPLGEIVAACAERFALPTTRLVDEITLDLSSFLTLASDGVGDGTAAGPAPAADSSADAAHEECAAPTATMGSETPAPAARDAAAAWILPIAAAVTGLTGAPDINLMPAALALVQHRRAAQRVATGIALLCLFAMSLYHISYFFATSSILRDLRAHATLAETTNHTVANLAQLRDARQQAADRLHFLAARQRPAAVTRGILLALGAAATDSLQIEELQLECDPGAEASLRLRVQGKIAGPTSAAVQEQFNQFHARLRSSPYLGPASVGPLQIESRPAGGGSLLTFELRGQIAADWRHR